MLKPGNRERNRLPVRRVFYMALLAVICIVLPAGMLFSQQRPEDYVLLSWEYPGMHSTGNDYSIFALYPPFNTLEAQVVKKDPYGKPSLVTGAISQFRLTYSIPGNSFSAGKTNFGNMPLPCS